jgi:hypothetical protein
MFYSYDHLSVLVCGFLNEKLNVSPGLTILKFRCTELEVEGLQRHVS